MIKFKLAIAFTLLASAQIANAAVFSPYADITLKTVWDAKDQALAPDDLVKVSAASGVKQFHLAFITDAGNCTPAWGGQPSYSVNQQWAAHMTDAMRANHIQYSVSFGGASGQDISLHCSSTKLVAAYEQIISTYQPIGLDFDIENADVNVENIMSALAIIEKRHPELKISFTLPVMPEGLTSNGITVLTQAKAHSLHYSVNIMTMDYGPAYTNDMAEYAIQAATHLTETLHTFYPQLSNEALWKMVEVTPMIGVNDVTVEQFTLKDADALHRFAEKNHLGGLAMWSISRDFPCSDKWASSLCSGNNLQTVNYEFAKHFL